MLALLLGLQMLAGAQEFTLQVPAIRAELAGMPDLSPIQVESTSLVRVRTAPHMESTLSVAIPGERMPKQTLDYARNRVWKANGEQSAEKLRSELMIGLRAVPLSDRDGGR